jgi:hypothetical protein
MLQTTTLIIVYLEVGDHPKLQELDGFDIFPATLGSKTGIGSPAKVDVLIFSA